MDDADPRRATEKYIEKFHIHTILENTLSQLLYHKPDNPKRFIITHLERVKVTGSAPLLTSEDLDTMFGMFDVTKKGTVTMQQANSALQALLGPKAVIAAAASENNDTSSNTRPLKKEEFVKYMNSSLAAASPKLT